MPELTLLLLRLGVLVLLWLFVLAAVRVIRTDLFSGRAAGSAPAVAPRTQNDRRKPRRGSAAQRLVVTQGGLTGTTITLGTAPITLGRADDSTLVITDDYASSRHARLVPRDDAWILEDLGSTNGTYLDRTRVTAPVPVPLGVPIRIGQTTLELRR